MRTTLTKLQTMRAEGEKIAALTCYDASFAALLEAQGVDVLLVGDSLGMVLQGHETTLPVTLDDMVYHTECVVRGSKQAFIVADMPFGTFQISPEDAFAHTAKLMVAGAQMVKLEGGAAMVETVRFLTERGIPVCGHVGLTPQSVHQLGGYRVQGKESAAAQRLLQDAVALEKAGAGMIVLEAMPALLAVLIDNTGKWRDQEGLSKHLRPGVAKVILTAPGKGELKNIVHGVNHGTLTDADTIISCASCTTNAIVPPLKAINDRFGLVHGHVETVHSFTSDQNLLDNYHKGNRRGRSAPLNMVITETGAASAVAKALPELKGCITGNSIRVPTPNVSMAILNLTLKQETTREELTEYLRDVSLHSTMQRQIDFISSPDAVSTDFVGSRHACVIDAEATIVDGKHVVLYVWYDNEFGYSCQVIRVVQHITGVEYPQFPAK